MRLFAVSSSATQKSHAPCALLISKLEKRREVESRNQTVESREERYGTRRDVLRRDFLQPRCLCSSHHRISFCWSRLRSDKTGSFNWLDCISGRHVLYSWIHSTNYLPVIPFTQDAFQRGHVCRDFLWVRIWGSTPECVSWQRGSLAPVSSVSSAHSGQGPQWQECPIVSICCWVCFGCL